MSRFPFVLVCLTVLVVAPALPAATINPEERDYQNQAFQTWFGTELDRKLADLPTEGKVPDFRIPYSGYGYPDAAGGTDARGRGGLSPLGKYDMAFSGGRGLAVAFERMDITAHQAANAAGLFGRRRSRLEQLGRPLGLIERLRQRRVPGWHGHCNGWTGAAIRHAEPQHSVVRHGVTFTPSDIKGLLAEIYIYSETEFLGGVDSVINPATFHISLANWLGKGDQPVGMDITPGQVAWNYPIYAYQAKLRKISDREWEVHLTATYADSTNYEPDRAPRKAAKKNFHYVLDLDADGNIVGGRYYGDSARIDMLWTQLHPVQGGEEGNENGNPNISVKEVLSIWRDSVPEELRKKWLNIDPLPEDAAVAEEVAAAPQAGTPPAAEEETAEETSAEPTGEAAQPAAGQPTDPPADASPAETPAESPAPGPAPADRS